MRSLAPLPWGWPGWLTGRVLDWGHPVGARAFTAPPGTTLTDAQAVGQGTHMQNTMLCLERIGVSSPHLCVHTYLSACGKVVVVHGYV